MNKNQSNNTSLPILDCAGFEVLLDSYLDNELSEQERAAFEAHSSSCSACESLVRGAESVAKAARELAEKPIPQVVRRRLRQVLREELGLHLVSSRPQLSVVK